jgi:hypothetical protein
MPRETDAADSLGNEGSPEADRHLAENFGMTVRQVRDFDPQTLDVTRSCKFLGLPLKRFDQLAAQPEARARWVETVARERKDLIELFPQASKELKEMLEAIRKFALRKCMKPDGPALVEGGGSGAVKSKSRLVSASRQKGQTQLIIGGIAVAVVVLVGGIAAVLMTSKSGQEQQAKSPADDGTKQAPVTKKTEPSEVPSKPPVVSPDPIANLPSTLPRSPSDRFQLNSVWKGDQRVLTVTERKDDKFTATLKIGTKFERIVTGTIEDDKIRWLGKDVRAIIGETKGGNYDGTISRDSDGDKIEFAWLDGKGESGSFVLRLSKEPVVKPAPPPPRVEDLIGAWDSDFGKVTLETNKSGVVSGYWIQAINKKGLITRGTFTPGTRTLTFSITQPWNNEKGSATFTLSADGTKLDGAWKHSSGNGKWQMTRATK